MPNINLPFHEPICDPHTGKMNMTSSWAQILRNPGLSAPEVQTIVKQYVTNTVQGLVVGATGPGGIPIAQNSILSNHIQSINADVINAGQINTTLLNIKQILVWNDTWTDNKPSTGYISWTTFSLAWAGITYTIQAGQTNKKYIYWTGGTILQTSDTAPTLTDGQFLIATNVSGVHSICYNKIGQLSIDAQYLQDFTLDATKMALQLITVSGDTWTDNSPSSGYIAWSAFTIVYDGQKYAISAGNTNLRFVYWTGGTTLQAMDSMPVLTDGQFMIAVNSDIIGNKGTHSIAYNKLAYQQIGAANIQLACITDAQIASLNAGKITTGTLTVGGSVTVAGSIDASVLNITNVNASNINAGILTAITMETAASGQRVVIDASANQIEFYGNAGGGLEQLGSIGIVNSSAGYCIGSFGSITSGNNKIGAVGLSDSSYGLYGFSQNDKGIAGAGPTGGYFVSTVGTGQAILLALTNSGIQTIGTGASWVPSAGFHNFIITPAGGANSVVYEMYVSGSWRTATEAVTGVGPFGGLYFDGANQRFRNTDLSNTATVYWQRY